MSADFVQARKRRSKTGCYSCRQRKVRCQEQRPTCGACLRLGLPCAFPAPARPGASTGASTGPPSAAKRRCHAPKSTSTYEYGPTGLGCEPALVPMAAPGEGAPLSLSLASPRWASLGEGLDINWLECWLPEMDERPERPPLPGTADWGFFGLRPGAGVDLQPPALTGPVLQQQQQQAPPPQLTPPTLAMASSPASSAGSSSTTAALDRNVTLLPADRPVLHHFTTTMVRFCILRNCTHDSLYSYILMTMGLFHRTLFDAMMAWSALHLAHVHRTNNAAARARYADADAALRADVRSGAVAPSLLLTTAWFLLQYQLILAEGVAGFCGLIDLAAGVARAELQRNDAATARRRIGPVGSLILVWMSFRDSQAAALGLGGRLLGCLKTYPHIYELVDASAVASEGSGGGAPDLVFAEGGEEPIGGPRTDSATTTASEMQRCMTLSFQNGTVAGQIKFLGRRLAGNGRYGSDDSGSSSGSGGSGSNTTNSSAVWDTIRASLRLLRQAIERDDTDAARAALGVATGDVAAMPVVEPLHYNRLLVLAAYYTSVIQYHNMRAEVDSQGVGGGGEAGLTTSSNDDDDLLPAAAAADRLIRLCQRVAAARPNSPQGIWPTHVLVAGMNTQDPIYQAWVVQALEKAECWGAHIGKARVLLEAVVRRQNATGARVNVVEVMKETTGMFIF